MMIADVMKAEAEALPAHTSSRTAARRMRDRDIGFLPICDQHGRVIGTITDRDLAVRVVAEGLDYDLPITDVMTREVVACRVEDDVLCARRLMLANRKSRLVVLDETGRLLGVVSWTDVTAALA